MTALRGGRFGWAVTAEAFGRYVSRRLFALAVRIETRSRGGMSF